MDAKVGFSILLLLSICWPFADARHLVADDVSVVQIYFEEPKFVEESFEANLRNEQVCSMCEQFTAQAITYLGENKSQTDIIESLHQTCAKLHTFQRQCDTLVDYYAPLFFLEISSINPADFCKKFSLCEAKLLINHHQRQDRCELCHQAMVEVLMKLKDPDTQLDIIEALLKGCDRVENYVKQCKKLVFEYGPLILANAEQFLETKDLCISLHICKSAITKDASSSVM